MLTRFALTFLALLVFCQDVASRTQTHPINFERELTTHEAIQIDCLAKCVYYEARGEGRWGMIAVGAVVLNRTEAYKQSICDVVYSPYQFSWTNQLTQEDQIRILSRDFHTWQRAIDIARHLYMDPQFRYQANIGKRLHYYNPAGLTRIPLWVRIGMNAKQIGNHVFVYVEE